MVLVRNRHNTSQVSSIFVLLLTAPRKSDFPITFVVPHLLQAPFRAMLLITVVEEAPYKIKNELDERRKGWMIFFETYSYVFVYSPVSIRNCLTKAICSGLCPLPTARIKLPCTPNPVMASKRFHWGRKMNSRPLSHFSRPHKFASPPDFSSSNVGRRWFGIFDTDQFTGKQQSNFSTDRQDHSEPTAR